MKQIKVLGFTTPGGKRWGGKEPSFKKKKTGAGCILKRDNEVICSSRCTSCVYTSLNYTRCTQLKNVAKMIS